MVYIQRREGKNLETVDEFTNRRAARTAICDHRASDPTAEYYLSTRPCRSWVTAKEPTYKIVRHRFHGGTRVLKRGLTLEQAQGHCRSLETSSKTATTAKAIAYTRRVGPWFDGYEAEQSILC